MNVRTHVVIPVTLMAEIDKLVGKRGRSQFLTNAAEKELLRARQKAAIQQAIGAWSAEDHPELIDGEVEYVKRIRQESEVRFLKQSAGG